ncbi:hypothetical protein [Paraburkholderia nemoris]|uniref:hypothetical protein n=1 Tax=Paraburkholderia nemoris TaxID=2793076 RepID=UPI001B02B70D|nr:hypothetical protein [Paraburkholderia nemoris]CAE6732431.1 hypothetical protein R75777_02130 [Paraburkholderia nemoris]
MDVRLEKQLEPTVTDQQEKAIDAFFSAVEGLRQLGVVRSSKYLGDIAEFLCCNLLGMELATNKRQAGYDGLIQGLKCQVKFSGGASNTVDLGDPKAYDILVIVLGPDSALRPVTATKKWLIYKIPSNVIEQTAPVHTKGVRRFTKQQIPQKYFVGEFSSLRAGDSLLYDDVNADAIAAGCAVVHCD